MMTKPIAIAAAVTMMVAAGAAISGFHAPVRGGNDAAHGGTRTVRHKAEWRETRWPFLLDQWGVGRAFVCMPADCGMRIEVFIRPKIGFCNCTTGVSDETELERVADTDLVSPAVKPHGPVMPVRLAWMHGLARPYEVYADDKPPGRLLSAAFNDECDAVVTLASVGDADPDRAVLPMLAFLNTAPMVLWVKKELGLEFARREW
jgi:hypothetical protein